MQNILLCVVGLTPQVITETLFALHQQNKRVDAIHVITTSQGKERINALLLSPVDGKYYQYLKDYEIDPSSINFGFDNIHTVRTPGGVEIDDIEDEEQNEWLLKKCLELTFEFTRDAQRTVFFSIAGGRKTMSACLMVAAQLYGRPQDRIYHVLVSPEFEGNRNFYYPPKISTPIELKDKNGQPYLKETRYAKITLVPIPFISIRDSLSEKMLDKLRDPVALMDYLIKEEPFQLVIDIPNSRIIYKKTELKMMPARLALYAFFAIQKKNCGKEAFSCHSCTECFLDLQEILSSNKIKELYQNISRNRETSEMSNTGITSLSKENFQSYKSKIRKDLEKALGSYALKELSIESIGKRPNKKYGIKIDKRRIKVIF